MGVEGFHSDGKFKGDSGHIWYQQSQVRYNVPPNTL